MSWHRSGVCFAPSRRVRKRSRGARGNQVSMEVRSCYRVLNFISLNDLLGFTSASMSRRAACCPLRQRGCRSSNCPVQYQNSHRIQKSGKKYRSWNYPFWWSMVGRENRSRSTRGLAESGNTGGPDELPSSVVAARHLFAPDLGAGSAPKLVVDSTSRIEAPGSTCRFFRRSASSTQLNIRGLVDCARA